MFSSRPDESMPNTAGLVPVQQIAPVWGLRLCYSSLSGMVHVLVGSELPFARRESSDKVSGSLGVVKRGRSTQTYARSGAFVNRGHSDGHTRMGHRVEVPEGAERWT